MKDLTNFRLDGEQKFASRLPRPTKQEKIEENTSAISESKIESSITVQKQMNKTFTTGMNQNSQKSIE